MEERVQIIDKIGAFNKLQKIYEFVDAFHLSINVQIDKFKQGYH